MNLIKRKINTISYRKKVMIYFFGAILVPFSIGFIYLYQTIVTSAENSIYSTIHERTKQEQISVNQKINSILDYAEYFSTNTTINRFFATDFKNDVELINEIDQNIRPLLSWMEATSKIFGSYRFFTENQQIPESQFFMNWLNYKEQDWATRLLGNLNENGYSFDDIHLQRSFTYAKSQQKSVISIFYTLPLANHTYLEMDVNTNYLFGDMMQTPVLNDGEMIYLSKENHFFGSRKFNLEETIALNQAIKNNDTSINLGNEMFFISSKRLTPIDGHILALVPLRTIQETTKQANIIFIAIISLISILIIALAYIVSTLLLKRIQRMHSAIKTIETGDFNINIPTTSQDEIDDLAKGINSMSLKINQLIEEIYIAEAHPKEAELSALQSQINPHFLFNTLETFRMMAELGQTEELTTSIVSLGKIMRYNISNFKKTNTLSNEINLLFDYVAIQNLLHNDSIIFSINIEDSLKNTPIPSFVLQPLVENSIIHNNQKKLFIELSSRIEDDQLILTLKDDGQGLTYENLYLLKRHIYLPVNKSKENNHVGLWNINQRMLIFSGNNNGLQIYSRKNQYFIIELTIPILKR